MLIVDSTRQFLKGGTPLDAVSRAWAAILPFIESSATAALIDSSLPWYLQSKEAVSTVESVFLCPSDITEGRHGHPFFDAIPPLPCGNRFASSSYCMSSGYRDSIVFQTGFRPRKHTLFTDVFGANSDTKYNRILDGLSNTFAFGEAAGDLTQIFNSTPSWQGGPHWVSNFRSFHADGAHFGFLDGSVQFLNASIDMDLYRAFSTVMGREQVQFEP